MSLKGMDCWKRFERIVGVDLSEERLRRVGAYLPEVRTFQADLCDLSGLREGFDLVLCSTVIEHVRDDRQMLTEICKITRPGGSLYLSSVIRKKYGWWIYRNNGRIVCDPTHVREYDSEKSFIDLIESHGFRVHRRAVVHFSPSLLNAVMRLFHRWGLLSENRLRALYQYGFIRWLSQVIRLPIPGYLIIDVIARKATETSPSPT